MDLDFAVIADYAATTTDGKLMIGGIFDTIWVNEVPAVQPFMSVVLRLRAHPGPCVLRGDLLACRNGRAGVLPTAHGAALQGLTQPLRLSGRGVGNLLILGCLGRAALHIGIRSLE